MALVLADTGGLYALLNQQDRHHAQAKRFYETLPRRSQIIVIEYVLGETLTLLRVRGHTMIGIRFRALLSSSRIFVLRYSTPTLEQLTFDVYRRYADKEWSYVDCALLASAREVQTSYVFSFDHHIDQMGLQRTPLTEL